MSSAVEAYLQRKAQGNPAPAYREPCLLCRKPKLSCYCEQLPMPLATKPRFVILMHPLEAKHPIGTGRMAHRCLANSELWINRNFADDARVHALLNDPKISPLLLFPGPASRDISALSQQERVTLVTAEREPVVIVLDGTWNLAKKMLHHSPNLQQIPRICFTPPRLSRFLVRKQPNEQCFSTLEAIHEILTLTDPTRREGEPAPYDHLLDVFDQMVAKQLAYRSVQSTRHAASFQARKDRRAKWRALKKERLLRAKAEAEEAAWAAAE